ncbi:TlyA family RNA methyltransferase [Kamptonema cortianum]|nr:TlyA family RNA methyltransferase [Oscillatoria laete-virens]MDK3160251.1 TlyA family RNA methyltransferase [Kamptonema cortianum]MDL5048396.1 TlyA family RNA methyltransferase [Oscillatoria amoena NRMC-F 0135]MDL5054239.1 TlyA family RNA methyltransferase [Oscillatoria laete-virens NRMC-F 0139]
MAKTTRLDLALVERGLTESREKAKRLIMGGLVSVDGQMVSKADCQVSPETLITLKETEKYVSRGGYKLEAALNHFRISVQGLVCLDVGASTGGFTDCLLQSGADKVHSIDVGHGQLAWKLRNDPRVECREHLNARRLDGETFVPRPQFACVDVSFISLKKILPPLWKTVEPGANCVALIKPQFEAGREVMNRCRGVLKDRALQDAIADEIVRFAVDSGFESLGLMDSPVTGADGNREFLCALKKT